MNNNKPRRIQMVQLINIHTNTRECQEYNMNNNMSRRVPMMHQINEFHECRNE